MAQREFIFLYPIFQIVDFEIKNHEWSNEGGVDTFRKKYRDVLNRCIDKRYRRENFQINFAVFDDCTVSDIIRLQSSDRIIKVGLDFKTHRADRVYPNQEYILSQLEGVQIIRIAGFHRWDCVEKLAKCACEKGLDVLVDEDLTESFPYRLEDKNFNEDKYPNH